MLTRISLIVAILAALVVGGLNFVLVKDKITALQGNLKTETEGRQKAETDFKRTSDELSKTNAALAQTKATLDATTEDKNKALADLDAQTKRADKLSEDLKKTRDERDTAQSELAAYKATGLSPQQAASANKLIKSLEDTLAGQQDENKFLGQKITRLQNELDVYTHPEKHVLLPASLKGKVLVSDPKWNFVVLNVGEDQGVLEHGELLVNRDGRLVAKVKITSVQKNRCVANVMPGWQLGDVIEGDLVIPAYPAS